MGIAAMFVIFIVSRVQLGILKFYTTIMLNIFWIIFIAYTFLGVYAPGYHVIGGRALSLLSTQNRVLEYEVKSTGLIVIASFSAPSKAVGAVIGLSLAKLLNSIGASARVRSAGTTFLIEVRKA